MKSFITGLLFLMGFHANASVVMVVDYSDYLDSDPLTNSISFTGVDGVYSQSDAATTNFPIIFLESFFNSEQFFPIHELVATSSGLGDMNGRDYGRAIDGDSYTNLDGRHMFPQDSMGFLATNRAVQTFSTTRDALRGTSIFDFTGYGFTVSDFRTGGDLYANNYIHENRGNPDPSDGFVLVGQWTASAVPVPAAVWLFGSGLIGLIGFAKRNKIRSYY